MTYFLVNGQEGGPLAGGAAGEHRGTDQELESHSSQHYQSNPGVKAEIKISEDTKKAKERFFLSYKKSSEKKDECLNGRP